MQPTAICVGLFLVTIVSTAGAQTRAIRGLVLLASDSTPLPSVVVGVAGGPGSVFTDGAGRFTLPDVPTGPVRLAVRRVGIVPDTVLVPADRDTITVFARPLPIALDPLVVRGSSELARERFETVAQTSTMSLQPVDITRTPGLLEADLLRVVQLLPGSVAKNDFTISYNVRGGEADQNLVLLDGITVFNPSHLGGLFSTFDPNATDHADFLTGGFPAAYSGRLSSVLDIALRSGGRDETTVRGQISLLSSRLLVDGPVGGATYLVGLRRTYADVVVGAFSKEELPYYFTDAVGKITQPLGRDGSLSLTGYWGRDALDYQLTSGPDGVRLLFDWGNQLAGVTWQHPAGSAVLQHRVGISEFATTLGLLPDLARFDNQVRLITAATTLATAVAPGHDLRVGAAVERYTMDYRIASPALETVFLDTHYRPTVWSAFVDDQIAAGSWLLRPGLRLEHVTGAGFTGLSPRVGFKVFLGTDQAVMGSAGRYYQAVHSIRDQELPITIFEFWIGANRYVPVARSDHLVLGYERWLGRDVQLTVEAYRKTFHNLVTPNRAEDARVEGDEYIPAQGNAWGADVLLRRHVGAIRGWIAYGYTRTIRRAAGEEFPPAHDRRHSLNVVLLAPGLLGSTLGVRWGLGSPLPYTGFIGAWDHRRYSPTGHAFDDADEEPISSTINGERYPAYSRLDVGLRWAFEKWGVRWEPYVQVANAYNRRNVFLYLFDYGNVPPTRTGVSQLPLLPTFGLEFTF